MQSNNGTLTLQNMPSATHSGYDVRLNARNMGGTEVDGTITFSGSIAVYYNGTEQKIVIGRDGLMVYHSHSSYVELRKNDSGQPLNVSGINLLIVCLVL